MSQVRPLTRICAAVVFEDSIFARHTFYDAALFLVYSVFAACAHGGASVSWGFGGDDVDGDVASQVENYAPEYMDKAPSRGHEASPHVSAELSALRQHKP